MMELYDEINNNKSAITTFIDLKKAFDTVDHGILLKKLYRYGIRGKALDLMHDYLLNRIQRVKYLKYKSSPSTITTSVPQGTILGPILFILYIYDLSAKFNFVISYA